MSIKIMSMIWDKGPESQSERFVLLALADYANDDGECWPSIDGVARKTCLTDRGIRKIMRRLEETGWLEIDLGGGRKNCNLYRIKTLNVVHPERSSTLNVVPKNPERSSLNTERGSAKPSITINEPSVDNSSLEIFSVLGAWASEDAVKSFIAYRKKSKSKGLTLTAAKRLAASLQEIFNAGGDTNDALGLAEERGWQTVKADWYFQSQRTTQRGKGGQGSGMVAAFAAVAARSAAEERRRSENPDDPDDTMLWGVDLS
jgi:hypothetical protein